MCYSGVLLITEVVSQFKKIFWDSCVLWESVVNLDLNWNINVISGQYRISQNFVETRRFCSSLRNSMTHGKLVPSCLTVDERWSRYSISLHALRCDLFSCRWVMRYVTAVIVACYSHCMYCSYFQTLGMILISILISNADWYNARICNLVLHNVQPTFGPQQTRENRWNMIWELRSLAFHIVYLLSRTCVLFGYTFNFRQWHTTELAKIFVLFFVMPDDDSILHWSDPLRLKSSCYVACSSNKCSPLG